MWDVKYAPGKGTHPSPCGESRPPWAPPCWRRGALQPPGPLGREDPEGTGTPSGELPGAAGIAGESGGMRPVAAPVLRELVGPLVSGSAPLSPRDSRSRLPVLPDGPAAGDAGPTGAALSPTPPAAPQGPGGTKGGHSCAARERRARGASGPVSPGLVWRPGAGACVPCAHPCPRRLSDCTTGPIPLFPALPLLGAGPSARSHL